MGNFPRVASSWASFVSVLGLAIAIFALVHCSSSSSPNLDDAPFDAGVGEAGSEDSGPRLYLVQGTLEGLPLADSVTLTLNGGNALPTVDGPFVFPAILPNGATYDVEVTGVPSGYACSVQFGSGTITSADASGVRVECSPASATLTSLAISAGALTPAFAPATLAYTAGPALVSGVLSPASTTVTAVTSDPNATITINGAPAKSGVASAPIPLKTSSNAIAINVTASDGSTMQSYAITISALVNDYLKASNTRAGGAFGSSVAFSSDGTTLAIGAPGDSSNATGIGGSQTDASAANAGAVYVFTRAGGVWAQQAYVKASNTTAGASFGASVALSDDGNTLAVGATGEASGATGIGGSQTDTSAANAGAVYIFSRAMTTWTEQAYVKSSNTRANALFGNSLVLSSDGNTLAVGSPGESSDATGIGGSQSDTSAASAGAVYVFARAATTWTQQAYVKASNTSASAMFGGAVALASDGNTMAVGAIGEASGATGIGGNQSDTSAPSAGAVYIFSRTTTTWTEQAYVKASNTRANALFGNGLVLSSDGNTLGVGSPGESSDATGVGGSQSDTSASGAGAAYVFSRAGTTWTEQAYVKASNTRANAGFGRSLALAGDGNTLVVGATNETSDATGINGLQTDTSLTNAGAVYVFTRAATTWTQKDYVKASNTAAGANFGFSEALSRDGSTLVVGAIGESSDALGVNGNQTDTSASGAGAAYVF